MRKVEGLFDGMVTALCVRFVPGWVLSKSDSIPVLYLKGLSTSVFPEALESIIGPDAKGFSAKSVERLKARWVSEFDDWNKRSLEEKRYVYVWADGIHFNVRLGDKENKRMCFLVLLDSTVKGKKELVAVLDGYRESKASWLELLRDLQQRGLKHSPNLAIGDGAPGFWAAMGEVWPDTKTQRCWVYKTANVLDKMPKSIQAKAKKRIHDIYLAETKEEAEKNWRRLRCYKHLSNVIQGIEFRDGYTEQEWVEREKLAAWK